MVVALALAAITFASQYPSQSSAIEPSAVPTFGVSGVAGAVPAASEGSYLRTGSSLRTLNSLAMVRADGSSPTVLRAAGGVAQTSSVSSGVTAATASSAGDGGVTSLADLVDPQRPFTVYVTQPGDSISSVAADFELEVHTLLANNPTVTNRNLIEPGLELLVPQADGILHKVAFGETLAGIVNQYDNITEEAALNFRANAISDPDNLEPGSYVLLPGATEKAPEPAPAPDPAPAPSDPAPGSSDPSPSPSQPPQGDNDGGGGNDNSSPPPSSGGRFANPLANYHAVSDEFGVYRGPNNIHAGIDLDLFGMPNSPIYSACSGVVTRVEYLTYSYGYHVVVDCGGGFTTLYAHFSQIGVTVGQQVGQGTLLGYSGLTGYTTGEHLHFEIRHNGAPVNPRNYINF